MKVGLVAGYGRVRTLVGTNSVSLIALSRIVAMFLTLITAPVIARALGPEGRGEAATALAAFALVPILVSLGVPLEVRRASVKGDWSRIIRASRDLSVMMFVPSGLIAFLLSVFIFRSMSSEAALVAFTGALCAPLTVSWLCDQSALIALSRYRAVAAIQVAQSIVYVLLVALAFAFSVLSVPVVLCANILGSLVTCGLGIYLTRVTFLGPRASRRSLLAGGIKYAGSGIAEAASNRLDQLLVLPLIGAYGAGLYSVAVTISSIPLSVGHALGAHFFNESAKAEAKDLSGLSGFGLRSGFLASFMVSLSLGVLSPFVVPLVFGAEFSGSIPVVVVSLIGSVAMTTAYVGSMMLAARGRGGMMTSSQVVSLVVGLCGLYLLAPRLGAPGVAFASTIAYFSLLVIVLLALRIRGSDLLLRRSDFVQLVRVLK
ncbi:oligosaccharide flippase family protein [Rhodococcus sp. 5G237]